MAAPTPVIGIEDGVLINKTGTQNILITVSANTVGIIIGNG